MVEVGTKVCSTPAEVRAELVRLRHSVMDLAAKNGLVDRRGGHASVLALDDAGDHAARALHGREGGHAGSRAAAADLRHAHAHRHRGSGVPHRRDERRALLPAARAVSRRRARRSGWGATPGSSRIEASSSGTFRAPACRRVLRLVATITNLLDTLVRRGAFPTARRSGGTCGRTIAYPTLEFRVCDVCTRVDEAVCIAAILQAIVAKLWKLRRDNITFRVYNAELIEENKWRAVRFGLDGKLDRFRAASRSCPRAS